MEQLDLFVKIFGVVISGGTLIWYASRLNTIVSRLTEDVLESKKSIEEQEDRLGVVELDVKLVRVEVERNSRDIEHLKQHNIENKD